MVVVVIAVLVFVVVVVVVSITSDEFAKLNLDSLITVETRDVCGTGFGAPDV
jgi:hypothetical protein